jgi:hypothetical protein
MDDHMCIADRSEVEKEYAVQLATPLLLCQ